MCDTCDAVDRERDRRLDQQHEPPNYWDRYNKGEAIDRDF